MKAKSVIWIIIALIFGVPVLIFVFKNLKAGYDDAEKNRGATSNLPVESAPPPASEPKRDLKPLAALDFTKLDFGSNSIPVNDHAEHYAEKLPPLKGGGKDGYREGLVQQGNFEVRGGIAMFTGAASVLLESSQHSGGKVTLELAVEKGTVRAFVQGLSGSFVSGYVFVDATPGHPGRVTGYLQDWSDTGTPHQDFYLESKDGEAQGIAYRVYRKE